MKTLDEIAIHHGTDKATLHPLGINHGYAPQYDKFFSEVRQRPVRLLEIGVGGGESIKTWLEYFPGALVHGIDIVSGTNEWNTPGAATNPRYTFVQGSQECDTFWACFLADHGNGWDIIVDDGGHTSKQIITTFKNMWPALNKGGLYCVEDLNCAYAGISGFCPEGWQNHMDFIKDKLDDINRKDEIEFMFYFKELAILKKKM